MAAAVVTTALAWGVPPASAHGGPVGASASVSPAGPLTAVVRLNGATWLGDGDPASGLAVSATASGPGSAGPTPLAESSEGQYQGTMTFPAAGAYSITVSWSGNGSTPGQTSTSVTVSAPDPPPTAAPPSGGNTGGGSTGGGNTGGGGTSGGGSTTPAVTTPSGEPVAETAEGPTTAPTVAATPATGLPVVLVPAKAPRGGYLTLTLAVPNPSPTADVVAVQVALPPGILATTVRAMPGWQADVTRAATAGTNGVAAVESITWNGRGALLRPGEVELFTVQIGPLPKQRGNVALPVTVTLTDGTAQTWGTDAPALRLTRGARSTTTAHG